MTPRKHRTPSRFATDIQFAALVFLSGMAALTHQFFWTRRLIDLLGASTESSARVFGTFFLGLSVGSAIAALLIARVKNPLRLAGFAQLSIVVLVIPVIYLSDLTDWIWPSIGSGSTYGSTGFAIKSFLTLGFVLPPSAMMGLSFPLIVAGVLRRNQGALGRSGLNLYAINTLGGAGGVLFAVMWALPQLGNFASMLLAAAVDGLVGVVLLVLSRTRPNHGRNEPRVGDSDDRSEANPFWPVIALSFFSGAAVLTMEVAAFQMFQLTATISIFSPAAVLFCVIASLGVAAAVFARYEKVFVTETARMAIALIFAISGSLIILAPQVFMAIAQRSNWFAKNSGPTEFVFELGALALLSVGPGLLVAGLIFPFAVASGGRGCSSRQAAQRLGVLLAVNGVGGLLGAEFAYQFLLPTFGVYGAITAVAIAFTTTALILSMIPSDRPSRSPLRVATSVCASIVLLFGLLNSRLPVVNPPPGVKSLDIQFGREGSVAVLEDKRGNRSILVANQYVLGGTAVRYNQERQ
ncbi:MAG: hypothetical protein AAGA03_16420, partial [Planctomycetota bacterium]